jgi:hypothetical protein
MTDFNNGQPYCLVAGEILADAVALARMVRTERPEFAGIPGALHVTLDARSGVILVGLLQDDGNIALIERILVDPQFPESFGSSVLPIGGHDTRTH